MTLLFLHEHIMLLCLNDFDQFIVLQTLIQDPIAYLNEVQDHLFQAWVSASTLCRTIREKEFTRKKVEFITLQQSEQRFMAEISLFNPIMLIWIDETG